MPNSRPKNPHVRAGPLRRQICHQSVDARQSRPHRPRARDPAMERAESRAGKTCGDRAGQLRSSTCPTWFLPPMPGMVLGNTAVVVSQFSLSRPAGRRAFFPRLVREERLYPGAAWPQDVFFEGAGDALLDRGQELIWCGFGFRSDEAAAALARRCFQAANNQSAPDRSAFLSPRYLPLPFGRRISDVLSRSVRRRRPGEDRQDRAARKNAWW